MTATAYFYANGKRKSAIATVRLYPEGSGTVDINGQSLKQWTDTDQMAFVILSPLKALSLHKDYDLKIITRGGGKSAQADAIALGISRALIKKDPQWRTVLKQEGLLTRDSRTKERKKPGLRSARRGPQFSKR